MSIESVKPSKHLILCHPLHLLSLHLLPSIFPSIRVFSNECALHTRWPKYWSFSISSSNEEELAWSPCSPRNCQESSPTPQFESINSLALSLLHVPTLISVGDYWKDHSFDCTNLCQQSAVSAFNMLSRFVIAFLPRSYGMITHVEPYVLECKVKCTLGSIITTNKASASYGIPDELFQILKDDAVGVLHSLCQQIWKTQPWPQDWKRSVFIPIPKKDNAKECSNYLTIALISHTSKVMLKIL